MENLFRLVKMQNEPADIHSPLYKPCSRLISANDPETKKYLERFLWGKDNRDWYIAMPNRFLLPLSDFLTSAETSQAAAQILAHVLSRH